jgi:hypothetical protein
MNYVQHFNHYNVIDEINPKVITSDHFQYNSRTDLHEQVYLSPMMTFHIN